MTHYSDINRRHDRFPVFDDKEGVKRLVDKKVETFQSDESWIITNEMTSSLVLDKTNLDNQKQLRRVNKAVVEKAGHTEQTKTEIERHRKHLPSYRRGPLKEQTKTGKTKLFGAVSPKRTSNQTHKVDESQSNQLTKQRKFQTMKQEYSGGRSYFVPKYVPSSIITEEVAGKIDDTHLYESMKKEPDSFLLFDKSDNYLDKNLKDPSVSRFHSVEHVNEGNQSYQAAIQSKGKKRSIVQQSLDGLIEEGQNQLKTNKYFNKKILD